MIAPNVVKGLTTLLQALFACWQSFAASYATSPQQDLTCLMRLLWMSSHGCRGTADICMCKTLQHTWRHAPTTHWHTQCPGWGGRMCTLERSTVSSCVLISSFSFNRLKETMCWAQLPHPQKHPCHCHQPQSHLPSSGQLLQAPILAVRLWMSEDMFMYLVIVNLNHTCPWSHLLDGGMFAYLGLRDTELFLFRA